MLVLTPKEETLIKSGKRIILAQQIEGEEDDDSGLFWIPLGMAAGMVLLGASLDEDKKAASPAE